MPGFDIGPFQNIVNVGWPARGIVAIHLNVLVAHTAGSAPFLDYDLNISVGGQGGNALKTKIIATRPGALGTPPITELVSAEMLRDYAIWAYEPYKLEGDLEHSSGGNFWFINIDVGAVHPDFVFSPYGSVGEAQDYIDQQHLIYPEYAGNVYIIAFFPPFENFSQDTVWRSTTFINLAAFPKDINGNIEISFTGGGQPVDADTMNFSLFAGLYRTPPFFFVNTPTQTLHPTMIFLADAFYVFSAGGTNAVSIGGTMVVHAANPPSITGPESPDGGGGEPG